MRTYTRDHRKPKFTRHTALVARLAECAGRELTLSAEFVSRRERAHLLRMADALRAFAVSVEKVAVAGTEAVYG